MGKKENEPERRVIEIFAKIRKGKKKKKYIRDVRGGPVVKNSPCNARDKGLTPGRRIKILHAMGQVRLCDPTTEPTF